MADCRWTEEQQRVIDIRDRNILVSAAAGSGKTAVLVERIIKIITDSDNPVDIDRLVVVTFTKAAAAEMRERISDAIEELLETEYSEHLEKQLNLIHNAKITTIDSFCQYIVKNNFNNVNLDPSYRIAEEGELRLLRADVIEELLEERYKREDADFADFIEAYSKGKTDEGIEELILKLYDFSCSYPWPKVWLEKCRDTFMIESEEELLNLPVIKQLEEHIRLIIGRNKEMLEEALDICRESDGPYMYEESIRSDWDYIESLSRKNSYKEMASVFNNMEFVRLKASRDKNISEDKKNRVKEIRGEVKDQIEGIIKEYFFDSVENMLRSVIACKRPMNVLIDLAMDFYDRYTDKKLKKNMLDFSDLEHFALDILVSRNEDGSLTYTKAAEEYSDYYHEILIDEYQDSNLVQETILNSISKERHGRPNVFMVGDVKQSIYKFRLARPELFMEKYNTYTKEDSEYTKIDLHKNFRSRGEVLSSINYIFYQIMGRSLGNIEYDSDAALYTGAEFTSPQADEYSTELMIVDLEEDKDESEEDITKIELEALAVARRIKELTSEETGLRVFDKKTKETRIAKYSDIVILLRSLSSYADTYVNILMQEGIPAYSESRTGYFKTMEIETILSTLNILDNPIQDIPLTAVLTSHIGKVTSEEMAMIKAADKESDMYGSVINYIENGEDEELVDKLSKLRDMYLDIRREVPFLSIYEIIMKVLSATDYYNCVAAMPAGDKRRGNIDMLLERAKTFESTSYKGLFNFVRYIEKLKIYEVDYGEASTILESSNTVRLMTIHKSKGLEFPIVIAAGLNKNFNQLDARASLVIHYDYGCGPDNVDTELRIKNKTIIKKAIQNQISIENLSEELRVLYVALTRAKEKLIMVGTCGKVETSLRKWCTSARLKHLPYSELVKAKSYMDFIVPALSRHRDLSMLKNEYSIQTGGILEEDICKTSFNARVVSLSELTKGEIVDTLEKEELKEKLLTLDTSSLDEDMVKGVRKRLEYTYEHQNVVSQRTKYSVSELKKSAYEEIKDDEVSYDVEKMFEPIDDADKEGIDRIIPEFIKAREDTSGADKGTAYHKVMEKFDYDITDREDIREYINRLTREGYIKENVAELIEEDKIVRFLSSDIGKRFAKCQKTGNLYRERQFVMGLEASEVREEFDQKEMVLVQGIVDAYIEEDDGITIVDYKTDRVPYRGGEQMLIDRYQKQLELYQRAVEGFTGKAVKEKIIYSFTLNKSISV